MKHVLLFLIVVSCPVVAHAHDPAPSDPDCPPAHESTRLDSPDAERAALYVAGIPIALNAAAGVVSIAYVTLFFGGQPIPVVHGLTIAAGVLSATVLLSSAVFVFGRMGGRRADFSWTLLGSVVGALPGVALLAGSVAANGGVGLALLTSGMVLGSLGAALGAVVAYESSSHPREEPPVEFGIGAGRIEARGRF